jgi:corrinoid protein of di/trimethylamine methyltransferase
MTEEEYEELTEEEYLEEIKEIIIDGDDEAAAEVTEEALAAGIDPMDILNKGLMAGADVVGERFETGEFFLPQLMLTGRALKAAMAVLEPSLQAAYAANPDLQKQSGTVVIGTVHRDIHDIGKNMVSSMLTASGFEVHDLGVDVPIKTILAKARDVNADIIACSALLTTSMPVMRDLLKLLEATGERGQFKVIVGGAPVTTTYAEEIGADGTAENAVAAVQLAQRLISEKQ